MAVFGRSVVWGLGIGGYLVQGLEYIEGGRWIPVTV